MEHSNLHPLDQFGDLFEEMGQQVLRDGEPNAGGGESGLAAEPVARENGGMGYVRGSHRWEMHAPNVFVGQATRTDQSLPALPDIEGNEDDYDIVCFDVEPGDVIVHDYRLAHGSRGNTTLDRSRRAVSLRFAGDDATVLHRPSAPEEFPLDPDLVDGDPMNGNTYPVVWPRPGDHTTPKGR